MSGLNDLMESAYRGALHIEDTAWKVVLVACYLSVPDLLSLLH